MKRLLTFCALSLLLMSISAFAQITPSDDSYTLTSSPTTNFGAKNTMLVESSGATSFVRFDLSSIPPSVTGAMVAKGTLKIYVATVPTAGSFNVDLVTSSWSEKTITANDSPTLGSALASAVPVTTADKNQYVLVDVTTAVVDWLNGTANDGIAIVPDGAVSFTLNSKETTTTSHPAELDIVLTGPAGPPGPISGVTAGAGLVGGGTKGNVTLSLLTTCKSGQVLQWNGSTWVCATASGSGTITGVTAGTDLTGGGTSGNVTLNLDTTKVPQLAANNSFTGNQVVTGDQSVSGNVLAGAMVEGQWGSFNSNDTVSGNTVLAIQDGVNGVNDAMAGVSYNTSPGSFTVIGANYSTTKVTGPLFGVEGYMTGNDETPGAGVFGEVGTGSSFLTSFHPAGVWGDTGDTAYYGVLGTSENGIAGVFISASSETGFTTLYAESETALGNPFFASNGPNNASCGIDNGGNLNCTGAKHAVVPIDGGARKVALSAIESPKNWFEDFGSAQLAGGTAVIALDPDFIQTVNTGVEYHVFLTPNADCKGLFIGNRTEASFEVHELGGGSSSVPFSYRIVALRKNYENIRLEDHTNDPDAREMAERMRGARQQGRPAAKISIPLVPGVATRVAPANATRAVR